MVHVASGSTRSHCPGKKLKKHAASMEEVSTITITITESHVTGRSPLELDT